jgi:hypothetical protein
MKKLIKLATVIIAIPILIYVPYYVGTSLFPGLENDVPFFMVYVMGAGHCVVAVGVLICSFRLVKLVYKWVMTD